VENSPNSNAKTIRTSKQRQLILDVFTNNNAHLSAEEVYQSVKIIRPNISLGTVYRNLEVLVNLGLINRSTFADGKSRYELANGEHHHHLVCIKCGHIEDMHECPMARNIELFIENQDFKPIHHYFEVYGYCSNCKFK
jgi:Fur family ferric uptake transcriptional regulator